MKKMNYSLVPRESVPQQSTTDYFRSVQGPLRAMNDGILGGAGSLGQVMAKTTPIATAARMLQRQSRPAVNGLGEIANPGFTVAALVVTFVVVTGALSYQAGKAMAPNRSDGNTWGWVGVPVGILTGPWGLGVMGIISNSGRK